jgi:TetR/AcrR family transcriptional regulator, mexJK operon transcriptional repressor
MARTTTEQQRPASRSATKRAQIVAAATEAFLRNGYDGTSMDQIAAAASVSKQTVYKQFSDKESLFAEMVLGALGPVDDMFQAVIRVVEDTGDLEKAFGELARHFVTVMTEPQMLRLRRLVIAEADRFPELGRTYYERGPQRVNQTLADTLARLAADGRLTIEDPWLAANHFTWLVLAVPVNRVMLCGESARYSPEEAESYAASAARLFLAACSTEARASAS